MKKTFLSIIMACFMLVSVCLTGCGDKGLKDNPPTNATVISQGGMSVIKGDYLYFVNGYVDETKLDKDDNKLGEVTKGAIYRTKLNSSNEIVKDKDGFLNDDYTDMVVSKVVGFSNGGFSIIDDSIYYATPYMKLSNNVLQSNRVEFHRIDIDGTDDKVIYVTQSSEDKLDWSLYKIGDKVYLVLFESEKIIVVNAKNGDVVASVANTTSYAILKSDNYIYSDSRNNYNQTHILYTRAIEPSDGVYNYSGNAICSLDIATGKSDTLYLSSNNTYTIKHVNKDTVYYTYTSTANPIASLYKKVISSSWANAEEIQLTNKAYDSYFFVDSFGNDLIIATADSCTWKLENGTTSQLLSASRDVIGVFGNYGYYLSEGDLIRFNIHTGELENTVTEKNMLLNNSNQIDFDNRRVFVYAEYTAENGDSNYYLTYFDESFTEDTFKHRFVGVFEGDDIPAKPEQPEAEYEGDEVEYVPHID